MEATKKFIAANKVPAGPHGRLYIEGLEHLGLTERQALVLIACYCEGNSTEQVAEWWRVAPQTIRRHLKRACTNLVKRGLPCPQPYGRGSRAELRAAFPGL